MVLSGLSILMITFDCAVATVKLIEKRITLKKKEYFHNTICHWYLMANKR